MVHCQKSSSPFEIDRGPMRDCRDNQTQPASSMALVLEGATGISPSLLKQTALAQYPVRLCYAKHCIHDAVRITRAEWFAIPFSWDSCIPCFMPV